MCYNAARNGHLEVLKFARANGCPWCLWTCHFAAEHGHLEVLKWSWAYGCECHIDTCYNAARNGQNRPGQMVVHGMKKHFPMLSGMVTLNC